MYFVVPEIYLRRNIPATNGKEFNLKIDKNV
jgi:hypothetical protein